MIPNIRVVLFDDSDAAHIPGKLRPYHRFHAERDFQNIVRWLRVKAPKKRGTKAPKKEEPKHHFVQTPILLRPRALYLMTTKLTFDVFVMASLSAFSSMLTD